MCEGAGHGIKVRCRFKDRIHVWYIYLRIYHENQLSTIHVGKYINPMDPTLDGSRNPAKKPPGMVLKPVVNNGINYQPQSTGGFLADFERFINSSTTRDSIGGLGLSPYVGATDAGWINTCEFTPERKFNCEFTLKITGIPKGK